MERTIYGKDSKKNDGDETPGQLEIIFDDDFKGL